MIGISIGLNSQTSVFDPKKINGLEAWYDASASDTITTATGVSQWDDKSGNGNNATQATGANQPATGSNTLNGRNVLTFDGSNDNLSLPTALCSTIGNGACTIIVVARHDVIGNDRVLTLGDASNNTRLALRYGTTTDACVFQSNTGGATVACSETISSLDYNIMIATKTGTTQSVGMNNGALTSNTSGEVLTDVANGRIGSNAAGTFNYWDGDVAEMLFYSRVLTADELTQVSRYLYLKWGVVVAGTILPPVKDDKVVPFAITYDGYSFDTNLDAADYKTTPTNTYNSVTDLRSQINTGNATSAPYEINMTAGLYDNSTAWDTTNFPTEDVNIIGATDTFLTSDQDITMVADSGTTYKSNAGQSNVGSIFDTTVTDANGGYEKLTLAADVASCRSTAGTYFVDGPNIVYIHTSDSRDLTANSGSTEANGIRIFLSVFGPTVMANISAYTENVRMQGFTNRTYWAGRDTEAYTPDAIYAKDCEFSYSQVSSNILVTNAQTAIIQGCVARQGFGDGFGYHDFANVGMAVYEVDCEAYDNGNGTSDNSSTIHEGIYAVRVNGVYSGARSRSIHDIDTSMSVNIGCDSKDSRGDNAAQSVNWACGDGGNATMYLINCLSSGSTTDIRALDGGTVYVSAASRLLDGSNTEEGSGTINSFVPTVV